MSDLDPTEPTSPWWFTGLRRGLGHHATHHRALAQAIDAVEPSESTEGVNVERLSIEGPVTISTEAEYDDSLTVLVPESTITLPAGSVAVSLGMTAEIKLVVYEEGNSAFMGYAWGPTLDPSDSENSGDPIDSDKTYPSDEFVWSGSSIPHGNAYAVYEDESYFVLYGYATGTGEAVHQNIKAYVAWVQL